MTKEELFKNIFNSQKETIVGSFVSATTEKENIDSIELATILKLDKSRFSKEALIILDTLEKDKEFPYQDLFQNLKWKINSLINIQDAFEGVIYNDYSIETFTGKSYFYYEGLHILREYFYCGLNNYLSASSHLLRTFIEFNIKQNYFDFKCQQNDSFAPLTEYFKNGIAPSNLKMVNSFLPNNSFTKPIKKKIQLILKNISTTSSHAYKPIDSNRGEGKLQHEYSLDTFYFWLELNSTINIILWCYYINHPMLFNPKDIPRKFGFNYPMGAFISMFQFESIKNSMSKEDFDLFKNYSLKTDKVRDLDNFYNEQEDMTDEEILASWKEEETIDNIEAGYFLLTAKYRAISEILASKCTFDAQKNVDESLEPLVRELGSYSWWKSNYKKI
ncbi:hypothetical protein [Flagellimonas sp. S3867]|uniref:hypothetical protein n=1 Tax=Flagellimonas sp. S3867 TaxID=2768063 RepID=UPI001687A2A9|nr:hypothetical protein [Flagellimonas sp. S3867]